MQHLSVQRYVRSTGIKKSWLIQQKMVYFISMDSISSMFDNKGELFKIAKAAQVVNSAQEVFNDRYQGISHHVRVLSCINGKLRIACTSSPVIQDIKMSETEIIEAVNQRLKTPQVQSILCLVNDPHMR